MVHNNGDIHPAVGDVHLSYRLVLLALAYLLPLAFSQAKERYVSPTGAGSFTGTNWDNAYSSIQTAVDACVGEASTIYLKSGIYSNTAQIAISNAVTLTLHGGYAGNEVDGLPGEFTNATTIITRDTNVNMRIFYGTNSTIILDNVTVSNGILNANGLGLFLADCTTTITNSLIANNTYNSFVGQMGGGLYVNRGRLVMVNSAVRANGFFSSGSAFNRRGGGLYANSADVALIGVVIAGNYVNIGVTGGHAGSGVCVEGGTSRFVNCTFATNTSTSVAGYVLDGGALHANNVGDLLVSNCVFVGNYYSVAIVNGTAIYLTGTSLNGVIADCEFRDNFTPPAPPSGSSDLYFTTFKQILIRNTRIRNGSVRGMYQAGNGTLSLTNCLMYGMSGSGIETVTGTVSVANCTIADNGGWGLTNLNAMVTVRDSIFWGNSAGGVTGPVVKLTINNTCSQEGHAGTGNLTSDPLFIAGYYLATNGLSFQTNSSPCIDAGSDQSSAFGLDTRTTRTDGTNDLGLVDLGFHTTNGVPAITNLVLYVDITNGNNTNNGWSAASALSNISYALSSKVIDGATINIAAGNYTTNAGEIFPLTIRKANLTLRGTNRNTTLINAGGTMGVLSASGAGNLRLDGLTFTNGYTQYGAGLYLLNSRTTVTNCTLANNGSKNFTVCVGYYIGMGIYANNGTLTILDSIVTDNGMTGGDSNTRGVSGGAIYAVNVNILLDGVLFARNRAACYSADSYGGCFNISGGRLTAKGCRFTGNSNVGSYSTWPAVDSGTYYLSSLTALSISNCIFTANTNGARNAGAGGILNLVGTGANGMEIVDTIMTNNTTSMASEALLNVNLTGGSLALRYCVMGNSSNNASGIYKAGTSAMTISNCLINTQARHGVQVTAGTVSIGNCTIADNRGWGVTNSGGTVTAKNSIVWGNTTGGLSGVTATYTDCQSPGIAGTGNISTNPLFADATFYHEKSLGGHCTNGYFSGSGWAKGQVHSPCIDAGDPIDNWDNEAKPDGKRINMGAYGNTPASSLSQGGGLLFSVR